MSILSIRQMAAVIRSVLAAARQYKPNLAVNDPDDPRYVSGRLCYETDPKMEYLIKDETVTLETLEGAPGDWAIAELATNISLEYGKTYTVTWDGKEYSVIGTAIEQEVIIGNMSIAGGDDTGEPFLIVFVGAGFLVCGLGAGAHTFSVATMGPRQIIQLPSKFLPDIPAGKVQGLASVATSGQYSDLAGRPTIPTVSEDIVRYGTVQSLTDAQKTRARTNIGAGTSSFDGQYSSLTGAPSLAAVATSGSYGDLTNQPVKAIYSAEDAYINADGSIDYVAADALLAYLEGSKYVLYIDSSGYTDFSPFKLYQDKDGKIYKYIGNLSLYIESAPNNGKSWLVCVTNQTVASSITYIRHIDVNGEINKPFTVVKDSAVQIRQLADEYIPSTIQRTGGPVILADSSGAQWRLTVGTDGTLSTEAVTE